MTNPNNCRQVGPKPFPLRRIMFVVVATALTSAIAQYFSVRQIHGIVGWAFLAYIVSELGSHAYRDNLRTHISGLHSLKVFLWSFIIWIPFALILVPGVVLTLYLDDKIEMLLRKAELVAADKVKTVDVQVEELVTEWEKVPLSWWWPLDWLKSGQRLVERKVLRSVQKDVLQPAPKWIRIVFSGIYAALRVSQILFYSSLMFLILRSYLYFLARSALYCRATIEFTFP